MKPENFEMNDLVNTLRGTCLTLAEGIAQTWEGVTEDDLTEEDCDELDKLIFKCDTCDWWLDIEDMSETEEGTCVDCEGLDE